MPPLSTPGQPPIRYPTNTINPPPQSIQRRPFVPAPTGVMQPSVPGQPVAAAQFGGRPQLQNNRKRRRFADRIVLPEVTYF